MSDTALGKRHGFCNPAAIGLYASPSGRLAVPPPKRRDGGTEWRRAPWQLTAESSLVEYLKTRLYFSILHIRLLRLVPAAEILGVWPTSYL
jgi:hypothetical protein